MTPRPDDVIRIPEGLLYIDDVDQGIVYGEIDMPCHCFQERTYTLAELDEMGWEIVG